MFPAPDGILNSPRHIFLANYFSKIVQLVTPNDSTTKYVYNEFNLQGSTPIDTVQNIYGMISSFEYMPDREGDYWQSNKETIELRAGDCEDLSTLMSSFFELAGLSTNFFVLTYNVNWKEYHVANLVYIPQVKSHGDLYLYLDGSYPHVVGEMPFYYNQAKVFGLFSLKNPTSNPILATMPQPLTLFIENAAINKIFNLQ